MMPVSAETMESPVTTVYRTAPNAAAAIVPIAYSEAVFYNPRLGRRYPSQSDVNQRGASTHSPSSSRDGTLAEGAPLLSGSGPATSPSGRGYLCWHDTVSG